MGEMIVVRKPVVALSVAALALGTAAIPAQAETVATAAQPHNFANPPPRVTYEFYGVNNNTYWTVIRRQGASMRATFYGDGPGFCFAGTRLPRSREYQGYARVFGVKRAFVRTYTSWERGGYWVRFYTVGNGRYFSYVAGRRATPPAWYVGKLRRVVDTCSTW
ncbi:MAG: hypothetical protein QG597_279 [Actinomycetota bacterium]|nr:hypothetical protein [Actinomycetota bacterium]